MLDVVEVGGYAGGERVPAPGLPDLGDNHRPERKREKNALEWGKRQLLLSRIRVALNVQLLLLKKKFNHF